MVEAIGTETQTQTSKARASLAGDMDAFLLLLVTQLKNQDPLSPLEPTEFTNQLVNFAGVEQQIATNENIEKLLSVQNAVLASAVIGFVGKEVVADTSGKLPLQNGEATFEYTLGSSASNVVMTISDDEGRILFTKAGETGVGKHEVIWDGKDGKDQTMPDGSYNLAITPLAFSGETIEHTIRVKAVITGISLANGETKMDASGVTIPFEKIETITKASD
jgi:flagellar basal-body rod modification protein FlgD